MTWLVEALAAVRAGFGFLAYNYAHCSSTQILQGTVVALALSCLARVVVRALASERMRHSLIPIDMQCEPGLAAALSRARRLAGFDRPIGCYWAADDGQLATLGYFRPSLLIGRSVGASLRSEELEAALAHELVHARRRDALRLEFWRASSTIGFAATVFATVVFLVFYLGAFSIERPLATVLAIATSIAAFVFAHALAARLERRAELRCDDAAAAGAGGPLAAAAALVKVARLDTFSSRCRPAIAVPLYSTETFHLRVDRLMRAHRICPRRSAARRLPRFLGALLLISSVTAAAAQVDLRTAAEQGCGTCALVMKKAQHWDR